MIPKVNPFGFLLVSLVLIGFVQNSLLYFVNARFGWGSCNSSIKAIQNFSISQFKGEWLEIAKYRNHFEWGNCQKVNFVNSSTGNASQVLVQLSEFRNGSLVSLNVTANISEDPAKWILSINMTRNSNRHGHGHGHRHRGDGYHQGIRHYGHSRNSTFGNYSRILELPLWVIDTDYSNYAILYSCKESHSGLFHMEYAWIVSRKIDSLTDAKLKQVIQGLESSNIHERYMMFSRQTFCGIGGDRGGRCGRRRGRGGHRHGRERDED